MSAETGVLITLVNNMLATPSHNGEALSLEVVPTFSSEAFTLFPKLPTGPRIRIWALPLKVVQLLRSLL